MRRNLLLIIEYDGTAYHGSQVQKNALGICQVIQDALQKVLGVREDIVACSRTDSGVHARMFCVNFYTDRDILCVKMKYAMNFHLPWDIRVSDCREVPHGFHARYQARRKRYVYQIWNADYESPFLKNRALFYRYPIREELLNRACQDFVGTHDFTSLCSAGSDIEDKVRTITQCSVSREGNMVLFTVTGDGFLQNMVRIMVGTLLRISEGKLAPHAIPQVLAKRDRAAAGITAPACGLYLDYVFYDWDFR